jgi:very-short-patch-repair endonuclease
MNRQLFIEKAIEIHGDKYDYSKVEYINALTKITIICKKHGEFLQKPSKHINAKQGCRICGNELNSERQISNTSEFIQKAIKIHGDKYDYSKVEYINSKTKVMIICKEHGEFLQQPNSHLSQEAGCLKCGKVYRCNTSEFIENVIKIHGDKYDYSKVEYINAYTKITIICKKHGEFCQTPNDHLNNNAGCKLCYDYRGITQKSNSKEFIEKAIKTHGDKYDYSKVEYINSKTKVIIICKIHGEFLQAPNCHIQCNGCPICINKTEAKLYQQMKTLYPSLQTQFKEEWCKKISHLPFDFCIPEHKIIIELDGRQHFQQVRNWSSPQEQFENDKYKEECANENGYSIIRLLQEDVFNDSYDWVKELCNAIEEIKVSDDIINTYLCKNDEYKEF